MYLGMMYHDINNYAQAARWFRRASDQELALAQFWLGMMHYRGEGVSQNYGEAARWLHRAANQGFGLAQY
jgi:TPR repeat protein